MSRKVMAAILAHPEVRPLLSDGHFSVDGTPIEARAATKSFQPKPDPAPPAEDDPGGPSPPPVEDAAKPDQPRPTETRPMPDNPRRHRNAEVNFRGEKRSNTTHVPVTDADARLYRKSPGASAMLCTWGMR